MANSYFKGHGLGNEYIVLDPDDLTFALTPARITRICDRQNGIGSDGILVFEDSGSADFGLRIWNPDGSEAETSGNGLRIFALYLHSTGRTRKKSFTVETRGGTVRVETQHSQSDAEDGAGSVCGATVHMGKATFRPETLPCTLEVDELIEQPIRAAGETLTFTGVNVGNPHCVVFRSQDRKWSRDDLLRLCPALETHPIFPNRINVQLAAPTGPSKIRILIWERGVGETTSSGSSACAAASAAVRLGLVTSPVSVESPGGAVLVNVDEEFNLTLTGPVAEVARGTFSEAMFREILNADD
ncbi:MAG: diaminopimelate epimerase [Gemmatimonadetes bacterium]|nr:diaminopimelate epimerase [Gemmatimonadota bacterium]